MSRSTVYNLLRNSDLTRHELSAVAAATTGKAATYTPANWGNASKPTSDSSGLHFTGPTKYGNTNSGVGVEFAASDLGLINGDTYVLSVEVASLAAADANNGLAVWQYASEDEWWTGKAARSKWSSGAGVYRTGFVYDGSAYVYLLMSVGQSGSATVTRFGLYHAASAAWAPAEGETLAGGGALMSANLLAGVKPEVTQYGSMADGVLTSTASKDAWQDVARWPIAADMLAENQTIHIGISAKWHGTAATTGTAWAVVEYADASGYTNSVNVQIDGIATEWKRLSLSPVVPSGMRIVDFRISAQNLDAAFDATSLVLSYGSPVTLASSAHTPYATQDHVSAVYATKASLKVTDDSIKAEVSARAQTDSNVADLSSRLTQTANSLTSEISDRKSAIATVTGLANAVQSTADSAAKQTTIYSFNNGDAGAVPKWIHLGTLTSAGDASNVTIAVYSGDGYNSGASQNSKLTISIKDGAQSKQSATGACGVTVMRENCDDALVDVLAQSATVYDVWFYAPWKYSRGCYSVSGQYTSWQHSGATQKDEPDTSATQVKQDVAYRLADATAAQTMATENQSSIRQLSDSITSEVSARTETDRTVSDLSSRLTQTASGLSASISKLSKTDEKVNAWFDFEADASGNPQLKMGSSTSPVVGRYTNSGLAYMSRNDATIMELDASRSATISDHMEAQDIRVGKWKWIQTQGGTHLTLVWAG